ARPEDRPRHRLRAGGVEAAGAADPRRDRGVAQRGDEADRAGRMMGWDQQRADVLEAGYAERAKWAGANRDAADDARLAAEELARRNRDATRAGVDPASPRTVAAAPEHTREGRPDTTPRPDAVPARQRVDEHEQGSTLAAEMDRLRAVWQEAAEAGAFRRGEDSGREASRQQAAAETARQQRNRGYERPHHQAQEQAQEMDGPSLGY
ncbi:hypothetical protein D8M34_18615, partial [Microbacterium sp. HSID17254]|uniref:hypothetical protein n=1 Tax=Microbacterium sp. HSID17254 TaxID=2419509 RepID=UPI000FC35FAA